MSTATVFLTISSNTCHNCHAVYGLSDTFIERARREGLTWHCPHCRASSWYGESEADRLKKQLAQAQTQLEHKEADVKWWQGRNEEKAKQIKHVEAQRNGLKGALRRHAKRVQHGVCPCCTRTFQNLARHMATQHPHHAEAVADLK